MRRYNVLVLICAGSMIGAPPSFAQGSGGDAGRGTSANQFDECRNTQDALGPWSVGCIRITTAVRVQYAQPKTVRLANGESQSTSEVVEFTVTADRPFPARALDPVLNIGGHLIQNYRFLEGNVLLFTDYAPQATPDGNEVIFQWGNKVPSAQAYTTSFKYVAASLPLQKK